MNKYANTQWNSFSFRIKIRFEANACEQGVQEELKVGAIWPSDSG